MPQLDFMSYLSQIFWFWVCFFGFHLFLARYVLPQLLIIFRVRVAKITEIVNTIEFIKKLIECEVSRHMALISKELDYSIEHLQQLVVFVGKELVGVDVLVNYLDKGNRIRLIDSLASLQLRRKIINSKKIKFVKFKKRS